MGWEGIFGPVSHAFSEGNWGPQKSLEPLTYELVYEISNSGSLTQ